VLDADEIRSHLNEDLSFSKTDRDEKVRRIGEAAQLLVERNYIVLVAAISPYREARAQVRNRIGSFLEVYVNASLAACIERDPKKLYARALRGELRYFTGIEGPFEPPLEPDVECHTEIETCEESAQRYLLPFGMFSRGSYSVSRKLSKVRQSGRGICNQPVPGLDPVALAVDTMNLLRLDQDRAAPRLPPDMEPEASRRVPSKA
jgi:adenylylsulfate kinase